MMNTANLANIASALGDENRLRALLAIRRAGELCLCQVTELLQLAPSTVSKHLLLLKQAGLLRARKQGRWMYFSLPDQKDDGPVASEARSAIEWVCGCCRTGRNDATADEDARRLEQILKQDPEQICRRQMQRRGCCSSALKAPLTRSGTTRQKRGARPRMALSTQT